MLIWSESIWLLIKIAYIDNTIVLTKIVSNTTNQLYNYRPSHHSSHVARGEVFPLSPQQSEKKNWSNLLKTWKLAIQPLFPEYIIPDYVAE